MSAVIKHTEERLMKVVLAPVISEKATFVAEIRCTRPTING